MKDIETELLRALYGCVEAELKRRVIDLVSIPDWRSKNHHRNSDLLQRLCLGPNDREPCILVTGEKNLAIRPGHHRPLGELFKQKAKLVERA